MSRYLLGNIGRIFNMASTEVLSRMEQRAAMAEQMIQTLTNQIEELKSSVSMPQKDQLIKENKQLRAEVDRLKSCLIDVEKSQGISQYYDFSKSNGAAPIGSTQPAKPTASSTKPAASSTQPAQPEKKEKAEKKAEKKKGEDKGGKGKKPEDDLPVDVSRLDFRVGKIISAKKHPDADSLYVEEVECGENKPRTVVSGLVRFIPIEEMQNRMVVLLCNLKPAKMRGITSEAMVMCASTPEKVEILAPPAGSEPGDLVEFEGFSRTPDSVLNPKKKIFETCAPDLKTDANKVATFKGVPFVVPGKGTVVAQTLANVQVK